MVNLVTITAMQPRMTREQLIDAARKAAPLLPPASQWLMNELANRLNITSVALCESMEQRKALAEDVINCARECDRVTERHTKSQCNLHVLSAQRELREFGYVTTVSITEEAL